MISRIDHLKFVQRIADYILYPCLTFSKGVSIKEAFFEAVTFICRGPYEYYDTNCEDPCPTTCDKVYLRNKHCRPNCKPKCTCLPGYARSSTTGQCVKPQNCPLQEIVCPRNQFYNPCKYIYPCCTRFLYYGEVKVDTAEIIASNLTIAQPFCWFRCEGGCQCNRGYIEHWTGNCYPAINEYSCVDPNATYDACGGHCTEQTCLNRFPYCVILDYCQPTCYCKREYIKNDYARPPRCVSTCPKIWTYDPDIFQLNNVS